MQMKNMGKAPAGYRHGQMVGYSYSLLGKTHSGWGKVVGGGMGMAKGMGKVLNVLPFSDRDYPVIQISLREARKIKNRTSGRA